MNDEEITNRLRAARPVLPGYQGRDDALDERAEATLLAIMREDAAPASEDAPDLAPVTPITSARGVSRKLRPVYLSVAAGVLVLLVAAIAMVAVPRGGASVSWAATPSQLAPQPITGTSKELLMEMSEAVRLSALPEAQGGRTVRFQSWALALAPDSEELPVSIVPEDREFTRRADGSVLTEVHAGVPYDAEGKEIVSFLQVQPGELVWREEVPPDEYLFMYPDAPPVDAAAYAQYFREHNPVSSDPDSEAPTTGDYFRWTAQLLNEWNMNPAQRAALLEFLAGLPDLTVDGTVNDRLGRPGVSFSTHTRDISGDYRDMLVVSPEMGVLSYERVYIGTDRTDIEAPAVVHYVAWE
ncbi:hypothetical protein ASE14_01095 [Agromyces sp. Root81]|uniref:hypothetical protein n=1 Tax=Agromyces sp. Root81 TaxID=1736601 RepID=UPI0006F2658B|nr:hypothetical protein [Agromyces sp. Root81]KRC62465.1 hypothetical protein ASE14_01095 [Agromyces sp. Root81]